MHSRPTAHFQTPHQVALHSVDGRASDLSKLIDKRSHAHFESYVCMKFSRKTEAKQTPSMWSRAKGNVVVFWARGKTMFGFLLAVSGIFPPRHGFPWPVPIFCPFLTDLGGMGKQGHFMWVVKGAFVCMCVCGFKVSIGHRFFWYATTHSWMRIIGYIFCKRFLEHPSFAEETLTGQWVYTYSRLGDSWFHYSNSVLGFLTNRSCTAWVSGGVPVIADFF